MNAPATAASLQPTAYRMLAIDDLFPSDTHIQALRRARFNQNALAELAVGIRELGVMQPIIARPRPDDDAPAPFEIVAGERRWLAARIAGLAQIPCVVREVSDADLVKVQLVENLQREGLHEMEEAEGYAQLMHEGGVNADAVADLVGKSRSHVYGRLKLLQLQPEARDAFYAGELDASRALELARITDPKKQTQILKLALQKNWRGDGPAFSVRGLREEIAKKGLTQPLDRAPFAMTDATLLRFVKRKKGVEDCDGLPACVGCPMRAGSGTEDDPDVCTDVACYHDKEKDLQRRRRAAVEASGRPIVKAEGGRGQWVPGYIDLDAECDDDDYPAPPPEEPDGVATDSLAWKEYEAATEKWEAAEQAHRMRTYRQILADDAIEPTIVEDKRGVLREMLPVKAAQKLLKPKGIELPWHLTQTESQAAQPDPAKVEAEREKQRQRQEAEKTYRERLLKAIYDKWKPPLKHADLVEIAEDWLDGGWGDALVAIYGEQPPVPAKMKDDELARLIVILHVADEADGTWNAPTNLIETARRLKIDPAKIKKEIAAEARAKAKGEVSAKSAPAKATKKKTSKK